MCEANLYMLNKDGEEELLLEAVDKLIPREDGILLENIFSQRKIVKGKIKEMKLVDHKIIIEKE